MQKRKIETVAFEIEAMGDQPSPEASSNTKAMAWQETWPGSDQ